MNIQDLIKQLQDMMLLYGNRIILTVTDEQNEYSIKEITGKQCAKYFESTDNVAEVVITIDKRIKTLPSVTPKQRVGRWIDEGYYADGSNATAYRCSECGEHIIEYEPDRYCKFCGAKMEEQE